MPDLFAAADLTVLTSAFGEGFPNVLVEAMASGAAAVATDVGDAKRIVGESGRIVAPGDAIGMASAVAALLGEPEQTRRNRAAAARDRVLDRFTLDRAVAAFDRLHRDGDPSSAGEAG